MLKALQKVASFAAKEVPHQVGRGVQAYANAVHKHQAATDKAGQINLIELANRYNQILSDPSKNADPTIDVNRMIQVKDPKRGWISLWDAADSNHQHSQGPYRGISENYSEDYHLSQEEVMGKRVRIPFNFCGKRVSYLEIEVRTPEDFARLKKTLEVPFENTAANVCVSQEEEYRVDDSWMDSADQILSSTAFIGVKLLTDSLVQGKVGSVTQLVDEVGVDYGCNDPDVINGMVFVIGGGESEMDPCTPRDPLPITPMDAAQRGLLEALRMTQSGYGETQDSFDTSSDQSL